VDWQMLSDETSVEPEPSVLDDRVAEIYSWRREQLGQAGYSPAHAEMLADDVTVDLHEARKLLERGCPEHTAFLILAPDRAS
jgi:hypothetical protein